MSWFSEFAVLADVVGRWTLVVLVMLGALPLFAASYQLVLVPPPFWERLVYPVKLIWL